MVQPFAQFERDTFPLITVRFTSAKATASNFNEYLDGLLANYEREAPFVLIFDASIALPLNPIYQKKQADWMQEHEALIVKYCRGSAFIIPSVIMRNALKMIFAISRNPVPFQVFSTAAEARAWANSMMASS